MRLVYLFARMEKMDEKEGKKSDEARYPIGKAPRSTAPNGLHFFPFSATTCLPYKRLILLSSGIIQLIFVAKKVSGAPGK